MGNYRIWQRGLKTKAEKAIFLGGPRPLGYKIVKQQYVEDPVESAIVKEIFQKYADGWSYQQLCDEFNGRHITTSRGKPFNKNSFHVMLKVSYRGKHQADCTGNACYCRNQQVLKTDSIL